MAEFGVDRVRDWSACLNLLTEINKNNGPSEYFKDILTLIVF